MEKVRISFGRIYATGQRAEVRHYKVYTVHWNTIAILIFILKCRYLSIGLCYLAEILYICLSMTVLS